ncbi:MAG: hypothetical protein VXY07_06470, partial [Planctomycetota bacterium]|nr:hypothetical protein [Planctomycetota bacterium]
EIPSQISGIRKGGHIQTAATQIGTMIESIIACTETSALVGGSHSPTPLSRLHNMGMGSNEIMLEARTSPAMDAMVTTSF